MQGSATTPQPPLAEPQRKWECKAPSCCYSQCSLGDSGRLSPMARPGKQLLCPLLCQPSRPPRALAHGDGSRASLTLRNQRRGSWGAPFQHCAQHSGRTGWWGANGHRLGLPSWLPAQSCQPGAVLLVLCEGTSHTACAQGWSGEEGGQGPRSFPPGFHARSLDLQGGQRVGVESEACRSDTVGAGWGTKLAFYV